MSPQNGAQQTFSVCPRQDKTLLLSIPLIRDAVAAESEVAPGAPLGGAGVAVADMAAATPAAVPKNAAARTSDDAGAACGAGAAGADGLVLPFPTAYRKDLVRDEEVKRLMVHALGGSQVQVMAAIKALEEERMTTKEVDRVYALDPAAASPDSSESPESPAGAAKRVLNWEPELDSEASAHTPFERPGAKAPVSARKTPLFELDSAAIEEDGKIKLKDLFDDSAFYDEEALSDVDDDELDEEEEEEEECDLEAGRVYTREEIEEWQEKRRQRRREKRAARRQQRKLAAEQAPKG